jgi:hypothetical protein
MAIATQTGDINSAVHISNNPQIDVNTTDWDELSATPGLTERFIEKYKDYVNWKYIASTQKMSEDFIIKHLDKILKNASKGITRTKP